LANAKPALLAAAARVQRVDVVRLHSKGERFAELFGLISGASGATVVVWAGYDNARDKQTLGHGGAGGAVSVPIA
jgi:hypothetical protein